MRQVNAIELKLFALTPDRGKTIPKTRQGVGFYAGLDEALALTAYGVDTVSLWHIFQLPTHYWVTLDQPAWDRATDDYMEYAKAYAGKLSGLIMALNLPLGYQCTGLIAGCDAGEPRIQLHLMPLPDCTIAPPINPIRDSIHPKVTRQHLLSILGVDDGEWRLVGR